MQVFKGFDELPVFRHPVVTVGSYDGVHLGHRALIERLTREAQQQGSDSIVVTFEPHPRIALDKANGMRLLTTLEQKQSLLEALDVDYLIVIPFDHTFAALSGYEFVNSYLINKLGATALVAGYNHRFGHDHIGCEQLSGQCSLKIIRVEPCIVAGHKVSSTEIRRLLDSGLQDEAELLLGHSIQTELNTKNND